MRSYYFYCIGFVCIVTILFITVFSSLAKQKTTGILSPLPDFLNLVSNNQVSSLSLWLPKNAQAKGTVPMPVIEAKSGLTYDTTTNQLLFAKDISQKLPMASLTKIMTAIIALEHKKEPDKYIVSKQALVGEDSMGLTSAEVLSLDELLYGLILNSGNDAAEVLAQNYPNGRSGFILAMNNKAASLGIANTHFTNPTGLEGDGDQHTTAYDLLVITNYVMTQFPIFRKVVSTVSYEIPETKFHKEFYLENETNLLTTYPGVKGVKTGYTPEAGLCLVTYLDYFGHKIIGVVLGSNNRRKEMKELLDYSLETLGITPPISSL